MSMSEHFDILVLFRRFFHFRYSVSLKFL
uniref:Uncharacterized protein n=1 Tax=Rhizophora mucronata TaxID=61149 RepID=A0A2P2N0W6_RHIMU